MKDLTKEELLLIIYSLNQTFHDAHKKLEQNNLGDIERGMVKKTKTECKELIMKLSE